MAPASHPEAPPSVLRLVSILFWLSIVLWMAALVAYALMVGEFVSDRALMYRVVACSGVGAMVTGGLYLLTI